MSPKKLYFRDTSGIRKYLRQFLHHRRSPFFGDVRREWFTVPSHDALAPGRIQSFPQELDLSPFASPDTPPDRLADAIRDLKLFLPKDCKLLGAEDLKITGQFPIDAGGFSDVWVGERNGTTVIIKSYRYNASSDLSSIYLVSGGRFRGAFSSHKVAGRGCVTKRYYTTSSTGRTKTSCHSLECTRSLGTRFA